MKNINFSNTKDLDNVLNKLIDTEENKIIVIENKQPLSFKEQMIIESIKKINNPFRNITTKEVAHDLKIGNNMAYEIFKRNDFPSVNIGRCWKVTLISYLIWKMERKV